MSADTHPATRDLDQVDYYSDIELLQDAQPYFDHLRARGPVVRAAPHDVVAVTGYDEGLAVFRDDEHFSNVNTSYGPMLKLPFTPSGDDITDQIDAHRHLIPLANVLVRLDPPAHTRVKSLLMGIITPKRFKESEAFLDRRADEQIDRFIDRGSVEIVAEYASNFTMLAIADLLGVPPEHHDRIRDPNRVSSQIGVDMGTLEINPFAPIEDYLTEYVEERRRRPREDVLSELAAVRYADGGLPPVADVVAVGTLLFAAGADTSARVVTAALRIVAEDQDLQRKLRADRSLIPDLVEETLRLYGTVRGTHRLVKKPARVGKVEVRPGDVVALMISAMDRDPRRFDHPHELQIDRRNLREHLAFGRGVHTCPGAPLARAEVKVTLERFFDRMSEIGVDETKHGPPGARRYDYIPSYVLQGLSTLNLSFTKA
jgi:cytochrome P450